MKTVLQEDEPNSTPTEPEKNQSQGGKVTNNSIIPKKNSSLKQNTTKMVNKAAKGKDLPETGTHQTGYLWLGIVSLCLAGIVIYFDKKSRWHH